MRWAECRELLISPSEKLGWVAYPAWSPDGKSIAYVENWAIYVRPTDGGRSRLLSAGSAAHSLAWSPDGKWIAFVSGNPVFTLRRVSLGQLDQPRERGAELDLGRAREWREASPGHRCAIAQYQPGLAAERPRSLFVSDREGNRDIYRMDLTSLRTPGAPPARLTTGLDAHGISLSADAKRPGLLCLYPHWEHLDAGILPARDRLPGECSPAYPGHPDHRGCEPLA